MRILVPFDFTQGRNQIEYVIENYDISNGDTLVAVHFIDYNSRTVENIIKMEAEDVIDDISDYNIEDLNFEVQIDRVDKRKADKISEKIISKSNEESCDVVVMSRRNRSLFRRLLKDGCTDKVLKSDECQVEVVGEN